MTSYLCNSFSWADNGLIRNFPNIQVHVLGEPEDDGGHMSAVANRITIFIVFNE